MCNHAKQKEEFHFTQLTLASENELDIKKRERKESLCQTYVAEMAGGLSHDYSLPLFKYIDFIW